MRLYMRCLIVVICLCVVFVLSAHGKKRSKCGAKCKHHTVNRHHKNGGEKRKLGENKTHNEVRSIVPTSTQVKLHHHVLHDHTGSKKYEIPHFRSENEYDSEDDGEEDSDSDDDDGDNESDENETTTPNGDAAAIDGINMGTNENDPYRSEAMAKSEEMTQMLKQHFMQTAAMQNQIGAHMSGFTNDGMNSGAAGAAAVPPPIKDTYTMNYGVPGETGASVSGPVSKVNTISPLPPMIKSPIINSYSSNQYEETIPSDRYSVETPTVHGSQGMNSLSSAPVVNELPETASMGGTGGGGTATFYNGGNMQQNEYSDPSMKSYEMGTNNNWGSNFMNGGSQSMNGYENGNSMSSNMHMSPNMRNMAGMNEATQNMGGLGESTQSMGSMGETAQSMGGMGETAPSMGGTASNMGGGHTNAENGNGEEEEDDDDEEEGAQQVGDDLDPIMQAQVSKWQDSLDPMVSKIYHETESEKNVKETLANANKYPSSISKYMSADGNQFGIQRKATMFRHKHRRRHNQKGAARQTLEKPPLSIDYTDKTSEFITSDGSSRKHHRNPFIASSFRTNSRKSLLREGFIGSLYKNLLKEDQKILRTAFNHRKASKTPKKEPAVQEHSGKRNDLTDLHPNKDAAYKELTSKKPGLSLEKLLDVIAPKEESNKKEDTSSRSSENKPSTDSQTNVSNALSMIDEWAKANGSSGSSGTLKSSPDEVFTKSGAASTEPTTQTENSNLGKNVTTSANHMKGFTIVGNKGDESVVVAITITKPSNVTNSTEHAGLSSLDNKAIGSVITSMINAAASNKDDNALHTSRDDVNTVVNKTKSETTSISNLNSTSTLSPSSSEIKSPSSISKLSPQGNQTSLLSNTSSISQLVTDIDSMIHPSLQNGTSTNMTMSVPSNITTKGSVPNNTSSPEDEENTASRCLQSKTCRKKVLTNFIDSTDTGKSADGTARASVEQNKTSEATNSSSSEKSEDRSGKTRSGPVIIEIEEKERKEIENESNAKKSKDLTPSEVWRNAAVENIKTKESNEIHESGNFDDHGYVKNSEESKIGDLPLAVKKSRDWKSKASKVRQNFIVSRLINKNLQRIEDILKKYHGYEKKYKQRFGEEDGINGVTKSKIVHPPRVLNLL